MLKISKTSTLRLFGQWHLVILVRTAQNWWAPFKIWTIVAWNIPSQLIFWCQCSWPIICAVLKISNLVPPHGSLCTCIGEVPVEWLIIISRRLQAAVEAVTIMLFASGLLLYLDPPPRKWTLHVNGNHKDFWPKLPPWSAHRKCDRINREFHTGAPSNRGANIFLYFVKVL